MNRKHYKIFSEGRIGTLKLSNRLVRSATWDPSILRNRLVNKETIALYQKVAKGGVGLIITGDFSVLSPGSLEMDSVSTEKLSYDNVRIYGYDRLIKAVRETAPDCKIIAQLSAHYSNYSPSGVISPIVNKPSKAFSTEMIKKLIERFVVSIEGAMNDGFDGIQFHAAHGGLLSQFMSPYTNRRTDEYGGSVQNRVRLIAEIVSGARARVGDFSILIKLNCTDYIDGGIDIDNFSKFAKEIEKAGVDAIEVSGGMRDCLVRSKEELGFPPVYPPESQTQLAKPERQSYFLKYVKNLNLQIPVLLVGGNKDVERLEKIVCNENVDFISLCRPLISEPNLPDRWLNGIGKSDTDCVSCNTCIYDQIFSYKEGDLGVARCLVKEDPQKIKIARKWLTSFDKK